MRSLNIAPRRFGKTTICLKRFLEALNKDPNGVKIILPYSHSYAINKLSYYMGMTNNKFSEKSYMITNANGLRGRQINKLFIDDYDVWFNRKEEDDIFSTIPYVEAWSTHFLTRDNFLKIMEIRKLRKDRYLSSDTIPNNKLNRSFISWPYTKILIHRKDNEDRLLNSLLSAGTPLTK